MKDDSKIFYGVVLFIAVLIVSYMAGYKIGHGIGSNSFEADYAEWKQDYQDWKSRQVVRDVQVI